jgi:hypothetical protein
MTPPNIILLLNFWKEINIKETAEIDIAMLASAIANMEHRADG